VVIWTAYGAAAYARLAEAVADAKRDDALASVTILVPTNICGVAARRRLAAGVGGRAGVAGISVLTVDRLAERIAAPTLVGAGRRPATGPVLAAAWRSALAADAGLFAPVAGHPATVRALVAAHRELRDADEDGLTAIANQGNPVQRELIRLHRDVVRRLHGFYDVTDLRRAAARVQRERPDPEIGSVILFLPQDLTRDAAALVGALAATARLTVIAGSTGVSRADAAVQRTLARLGLPSENADLSPATPAATEVRHASDADDEVRAVVREVMTALRSTPAHRVAVLYGSAQPYARLLAEHLGAAGLTRSGAGVRPTIERTLARLLLDLLALPAHDWRRDEVTSVIARATIRQGNGRRLPAPTWERMSREAGVVAGDDWRVRLTRYADELRAAVPADATEAWRAYAETQAQLAEALRDFVLDLRAHLEQAQRITDWPTLARWAGEAFAKVAGDLFGERPATAPDDGEDADRFAAPVLPEEEWRAADRIRSTVDGLAGLATVETRADLATLRDTLELELGDDLPRHGRFGTGVLVAPLSESVGLDADVVFVVGLADDLVPGRLDPDALLDDDARARGGLRPLRERLDRAHRHLLAAFAAGTRAVASYPRGDLRRSAVRLPSRWLLPTLRGLDPAAVHGSPSYAAALHSAQELATDQEWRLRAASAAVGTTDGQFPGPRALAAALPDDTVVARALDLLAARASGRLTRFDGDLSGHAIPVPGEDHLTSATALESWTRCPHGYFLERLLGVSPVESPEEILLARAIDIGSIVHESLDEFHQAYGQGEPGRPWTASERAALHAIARRVAARYTERGLTGHPVLWERELANITHALDVLLDQDQELRARTGRVQVRSELAFGMRGEPPVELALPSGRTIRVRGSADRVDRAGSAITVVDYKTGSDWSYRDISEANPTAYGSKLQLPVYAKAARAALAGGDPTVEVSAEYWFVGRSTSRIGVPLTPEVERVFLSTVDAIVSGIAAGLFPQRPPADDNHGFGCPSCDPDGLGAAELRGAWRRKRADPRLAAYLSIVEPPEAGR
jgi:ATP-dependent helicase/nuclease subunit B